MGYRGEGPCGHSARSAPHLVMRRTPWPELFTVTRCPPSPPARHHGLGLPHRNNDADAVQALVKSKSQFKHMDHCVSDAAQTRPACLLGVPGCKVPRGTRGNGRGGRGVGEVGGLAGGRGTAEAMLLGRWRLGRWHWRLLSGEL